MVFTLLSHLSQTEKNCFQAARLIATDMDGTLTEAGKFAPKMLQALEALAEAGLQVLIVTGRSAGWVSSLAHYLPIAGAIAENGGIFYSNTVSHGEFLVDLLNGALHRQQLAQQFRDLQADYPHLQASMDNPFRITDWTFDLAGLTTTEILALGDRCRQAGRDFTYSSIQGHIKPQNQDKATGLLKVLTDYFPDILPTQVVTVGDSPNDESLFNSSHFPLSVGVANVIEYRDRLTHCPAYLTEATEGLGFCELSQFLLRIRGNNG
ncbi:HAD family phosphatase [Phormidium sp. CLA17]|uniref:HAD-IIB family hydrolase n=1 Tax=Leptolyngbya sp. Cla-17 TaxID=2803751 RepID=UPI001490A818|nr:HAD family hydrolase [Leptolyngbya sp. Cla-17]MBM0743522.1 HAD family phosphatase [Leptolyngbya sp. Cla-17]